ncbi:tRNA dihydrouridine synthase DusB [Inconstantimicrobium mannanitabidum]|uniref:tRNA-dihydrouridine synthase n=1 Tax=Inconstantimicrobium mannanitabidum TaxID=1604901 RepID=A0ACB5RIQ0_9CLOT|nr:tRNA dihydrouridine synthase DusB [Clostridium sp. TW13]GKX68740.1 tRNA-dihydrouridine synthase [Clostridium sp. TW13]
MKIANLEFENNVFLAPMAGVTDISFRGLCKEMGCGLVYTEMVSAKALYYESQNTKELMRVADEEKPVAIQMFGNDPKIMAYVTEKYFNENDNFCIVDINMGCPAPKIVKNGEGSALMKSPWLAYDIVSAVKKVSNKPVTVKFRKGFTADTVNAVEFAKIMEDAGADVIAVHGRTREQMYEGKADWDIIGEVKNKVKIPVIGNGDVFTPEDALSLKQLTNCDGIMVARGSMGNPWIFKQILQKISGEEVIYPEAWEKIDMAIRHYELSLKYDGEHKAVREMRKHAAWYIKGLKNCTDIKEEINKQNDSEEVRKILLDYKNYLKNNFESKN